VTEIYQNFEGIRRPHIWSVIKLLMMEGANHFEMLVPIN